MDFTVKKYNELLVALKGAGYSFQTFEDYLKNPKEKVVILRHDVDLLPENSLKFAQIQNKYDIKGTYYFRAVPESWDEKVIKEIARLGHEIGYHYECLTVTRGDTPLAIQDFEHNLTLLRELYPVTTICMHGSPMSRYDSRELWKSYDYRAYNLIGEPYFDIDFDKVFYITDTGRRWDGAKVSVRDKVNSSFSLTFHRTNEIIDYLKNSKLPDQIMFTFHPQRWNDNFFMWSKELILQNFKNVVKKLLFVK